MEEKLDEDGVGIVLLYSFMEEFFPSEKNTTPDVFKLWHWNGYANCNKNYTFLVGYLNFL